MTVYYQTEPLAGMAGQCDLRWTFNRSVLDEVWDYSWHNIDLCRGAPGAPVLRYVPPGALPSRARATQTAQRPCLVFFGAHFISRARQQAWAKLSEALGERLVGVRSVYTDAAFQRWLSDNSSLVFLNLHKGTGDHHNPVSVRLARLLSAGGLVISERSYPADEAQYAGIVPFLNVTIDRRCPQRGEKQMPSCALDDVSAIVSEFEQISTMSAGQRHAEASRRAALFAREFAPEVIFRRAGLHTRLLLLRDSGAAG